MVTPEETVALGRSYIGKAASRRPERLEGEGMMIGRVLVGPLALVLLSAVCGPELQAQYLGGGEKSAAETQLADLRQLQDKFSALAGAFPAELYDWRPMEGVRSVRDVFALIVAETTLFPTAWGFEPPSWVDEPTIGAELARIRALDPEGIEAEIVRGYGHTLALVEGLDAEDRSRSVNFFGLTTPLASAVTLMANDMHEHLGQLVAYARMNRIVPPWSRRSEG